MSYVTIWKLTSEKRLKVAQKFNTFLFFRLIYEKTLVIAHSLGRVQFDMFWKKLMEVESYLYIYHWYKLVTFTRASSKLKQKLSPFIGVKNKIGIVYIQIIA